MSTGYTSKTSYSDYPSPYSSYSSTAYPSPYGSYSSSYNPSPYGSYPEYPFKLSENLFPLTSLSTGYKAPPTIETLPTNLLHKTHEAPPKEAMPTEESDTLFTKFLKEQNNVNKWIPETTPTSLPELPIVSSNEDENDFVSEENKLVEESSSSDWSSSDNEEEGNELRPSAHMNLRSKFEWLSTQQEDTPPIETTPFAETMPIIDTTPTKKKPPPVAPKPKLFRRVLSNEVTSEGPVSFDEVMMSFFWLYFSSNDRCLNLQY